MAVTINVIFTEKPESPQISKKSGVTEIVRIYAFNQSYIATIDSYLPAIGNEVTGSGFVADIDVRNAPGYGTLLIKFLDRIDTPSGGTIHSENGVEYELNVNLVEKPLETKVNSSGVSTYLMKWNHNLYERVADKDASTSAIPAWFDTAKTPADADGVNWAWAKIRPGDPKDGVWKLANYSGAYGTMTKPGVESYLVAQPVIMAKRYNKSKSTAEAYLLGTVGLQDPGDRFDFPASGSGIYRWLAYPVGITSDGEYWIAQNQYMYADKWDTDLYSVIT
jgi:hypothetical protein